MILLAVQEIVSRTLTRSTVHVTHCVLGWAPTVIGGLVGVVLSLGFFYI